jgi:hypothetical protein
MRTLEETVDYILATKMDQAFYDSGANQVFYAEIAAWMNETAAVSVVDASCIMAISCYVPKFSLFAIAKAVGKGGAIAEAVNKRLWPTGPGGLMDESLQREALKRLGDVMEARGVARIQCSSSDPK